MNDVLHSYVGCEDTWIVCRVSDPDMRMRILGVRMYCVYIGSLNALGHHM